MQRILAVLVTTGALVGSVSAQTYGTPDGGCERAAGNPVNDTDVYFDGQTIGGQDWTCELIPAAGETYIGQCEDDGGGVPIPVSFTVKTDGDTITITSDADDRAFVMKLCE